MSPTEARDRCRYTGQIMHLHGVPRCDVDAEACEYDPQWQAVIQTIGRECALASVRRGYDARDKEGR